MSPPARVHVLRREEQRVVPWKNGGGTTREVAVDPEGAGVGAFRWRVSAANVAADGPFSRFPGVDRVLYLARGPGMDLWIDGAHRRVDRPLEAVAFPGEAEVSCRLLGGPVEDLNVMVDRARARALPRVLRLAHGAVEDAVACAAAGDDVLLAVEGTPRATPLAAGTPLDLGAGDAVRLHDGAAGRAWRVEARGGDAVVLLVSFEAARASPGGSSGTPARR